MFASSSATAGDDIGAETDQDLDHGRRVHHRHEFLRLIGVERLEAPRVGECSDVPRVRYIPSLTELVSPLRGPRTSPAPTQIRRAALGL